LTNHYEILGIPNYSSVSLARKAYIRQIKMYHPDLNKTSSAINISKNLNVAKEALESESKKVSYDRLLRRYLAGPRTKVNLITTQGYKPHQPSRRHTRKERSRRNMARNRANWIKEYQKWLKMFPMGLRYTILGIIDLLFLFLWFQAINRGRIGVWLAMSMVLIFMHHQMSVWITSVSYNNALFKKQKGLSNVNLDKHSAKVYNLVMYGGLTLVVVLKLTSFLV
jgi:curved DNA-binding protein CbpA